MKDADKTNHHQKDTQKHFFLILQIMIAVCLTAIILLLEKSFFWKANGSGILFSCDIQYTNPENNHWQIFYTAAGDPELKSLPAVPLNNQRKVEIPVLIPVKKLTGIRLDFGSNPGNIECRGLRIRGEKDISLKDMKMKFSTRIKNLVLHPDGLNCSSSGNDPSITFELKDPLAEGNRANIFEPWTFSIMLISVFIIAFAASRVITSEAQGKNWLFWSDGILLLVIATALFLPMSKVDSNQFSTGEKRRLAGYKPLISKDKKINFSYGEDFDKWFNDHFFGRGALLDLNNLLNLIKTPFPTDSSVYRGFDNWYFYSRDNALRNYHNLDLFSKKELSETLEDLRKIQTICSRLNKKLYLVIVPDKHKIYGEYFPGAAKIRPDSASRGKQFVSYLKRNGINAIYLYDALMKQKKNGLLYWKHDTHWNEMGAYFGYLEIMKHIRKDFPAVNTSRIEKIEYCKTTGNGDLADMIFSARREAKHDPTLYPTPRYTCQYEIQGDPIDKNYGFSQIINQNGQYKMLVLRDSFSTQLLPYMGNSFKNIAVLWSTALPVQHISEFQQADIVFFECIERFLPDFLSGIHDTRINIERGIK